MKRMLLFLVVLGIVQPLGAVTIPPSTMRKWDVKDIVLCASNTYPDWQAYQVVRVTATFTGPATLTVQGFWDGKNVAPCAATAQAFRIRFNPHIQGVWDFTISNNMNDPGLTVTAAESGAITVNAPGPSPAGKTPRGFLRRDTASGVGSYIWGTNEHQYLWGQTYYQIVNREVAGQTSTWQTAVSNSTEGTGTKANMNKIRLLIAPWNPNGGGIDSQPYKQTNNVPNRDQLNVPHWQALDRIIQHLNERNIVAEVVIFRDEGDDVLLGTPVQDCRYLRYAVSRYAAYPNVIWSLTNEWESAYYNAPYWSDLGCAIRGCAQTTCTGSDFSVPLDPWLTAGGKQRVLTIHPSAKDPPQTGPYQFCFDFATAPWPSAASLQSHKRNEDNSPPNAPFKGDQRGYESIACNRPIPGTSTPCTLPSTPLPVSNDEYGYISVAGQTQTEHRNMIWGIATGGGYGTAGDLRTAQPPIQWTVWSAAPEYDDIERLVNFFTSPSKGIEYWKMSPQTACQVNTRAHTLAEVGKQYVVYTADGAPFSVTNLTAGQYQRTWFDPRNANPNDPNAIHSTACVNVTNPITPPTAGVDWVLLLKKTGTCF